MDDFDDLDPQKFTGIQGVVGLIIWLIALPILQFIPCSNKEICPYGVIENSLAAFEEIAGQPMHILWISLIIIIFPLIMSCALNVTKYGSSA
jgi:hypothetical protein